MSVKSNLKLAAYFERRARLERDESERSRFAASAREYAELARAAAERLSEAGSGEHPSPRPYELADLIQDSDVPDWKRA